MNPIVVSRNWWHPEHPHRRRMPLPNYPNQTQRNGAPTVDQIKDNEFVGFPTDLPISKPIDYTGR